MYITDLRGAGGADAYLRVEYALTDLGRRACDVLESMRQWAEENLDDVLAARAAFDAADVTGAGR